ncbi:MAG TPA: biotin--[acetyl-CoA-carboxylase] ligase [Oleiagrimonas sp.]|nr:biotin--[acetyl-CoA-carboxylase] ligase [Oleiagrimonas sp.]
MMKNILEPREVLKTLASGKSVSGAGLAERIGVTRAAVWKHIDALRSRGLPIDARTGLGYRLPWPTQMLDAAEIEARLDAADKGLLEVHWELDSTSSELVRRQDGLPDLYVVLAEGQQAGRGRRGRMWLSPPGLNIYLSCLKRFEQGFAGLSGLSLTVGVAVAQALEDVGVTDAGLKWPNDILARGGKLAGILVELNGEYQGPCVAIVGVGVNVRLPPSMREGIEQPVMDLAGLCDGQPPDRNLVAARLVTRLRASLRGFETHGFSAFADDFARLDLLRGKSLRLHGAQGTFEGVGAGVDTQGALLVRTGQGEIRVDSAEVTVRAQ